jgi:iron complex transport system substrate-binding protein
MKQISKNRRRTAAKVLTLLLTVALLTTGCATSGGTSAGSSSASAAGSSQAATRTITDMLGREVEIPTKINSIVCTGCGALRMICYAQAQDLVTGVEDLEKTNTVKRPYGYAYYDTFQDLPSIGKGGGNGYTAYDEEIIKLQPDLIFSAYSSDALEQLAQKTGIPVVSIRYDSSFLDTQLEDSLKLIGDILGKQDRCEEVISYLETLKTDLNDRTKDIPDEKKPTVYAGAVTFGGGHGFEGTYGNFSPLVAINAINVADETGEKSGFEVDLEKVVSWDPDVIFLDPGNMDLVNEEYAKSPDYFNSLRAVKNGRVYSMISYNYYTTNVEIAIADAYYAGTILYPDQFADIDIAAKMDELLQKFDGKAFYTDMKGAGLSFGQITIGG